MWQVKFRAAKMVEGGGGGEEGEPSDEDGWAAFIDSKCSSDHSASVSQMNGFWCKMCKSRNNSEKMCVKLLAETGRVSLSTVKQVCSDVSWKATLWGESHCSNTTVIKADYSLQLHMGTKRSQSCGLMKRNWTVWSSWALFCLWDEGESLPTVQHGDGSTILWGGLAAGRTGELQKYLCSYSDMLQIKQYIWTEKEHKHLFWSLLGWWYHFQFQLLPQSFNNHHRRRNNMDPEVAADRGHVTQRESGDPGRRRSTH